MAARALPVCQPPRPRGRPARRPRPTVGLTDPVRRPGSLLPYCIVAGSMSLGYGSIYTLLADLRDRYGFSEAQLGVIVAAGFLAGFVTQLALARLADRGYAPLLVRGGVVLAMARDDRQRGRHRVLGVPPRAATARAREWRGRARDPPHRDHPGARRGRRQPRTAGGVRRRRLHARTARGRGRRRGVRHPRPVRLPRRGVRRRVRARVPPRSHRRCRRRRTARHALRALLVRPAIQATLAACVAFYLTVGMFEAIWAVLLRDHGAETWLIGLTLSMFTLPMIFLAPIGGRQAQARGPLRVVSVSLTIATICTFSYGVLPEPLDAAGGVARPRGRRLVHHAEQPGGGGARQPARTPLGRAGTARCDRARGRRTHRPGRGLPLRGGRAASSCAPAPPS